MKDSLGNTLQLISSWHTIESPFHNKVWRSVWTPLRIPMNSSVGYVSNSIVEPVREIVLQSI